MIWPALLLLGCEALVYYNHLTVGQLRILNSRRPIGDLLSDAATSEALKEKLQAVAAIRNFAGERLHLPVDNHYATYVDLKRPYVAWNVFAAPEFSLTPHTWRYPIIGEAAYRGYFSKTAAEKKASRLKSRGLDTYVAGVRAYSTLGWFDDAVFSTMLQQQDIQLAAVIFHELAHQKLFVKGDTAFNESFASAVEREGMRRWLQEGRAEAGFKDYLAARRRHRQFVRLIDGFRKNLAALYQTDLPIPSKRRLKRQILESLTSEYEALKAEWHGYDGYDGWFAEPLNNAKLNAVSVYHDWVPAFQALLRHHENDLEAFYEACKRIAALPKAQRHAALAQLPDGADSPTAHHADPTANVR